ncbi:D-aminoacylase [Roseiconus nitratireducens]|uniref:D-aminoacylase n=1 Tax=Roseiconus nitratireducens TaxID=2605748 RepID=A0A5M6DLT4_9BACT|nr:D-aminoacylase [Roseiconus nitratireducens]KAA5547212.1 D-aminoacylase [Roseiconus nitratireducens]
MLESSNWQSGVVSPNIRQPAVWRAAVGCAAWILLAIGVARAEDPVTIDLLLRGGELHLGDGQPPIRGDVAISGDRIVAVGQVEPELPPRRVIDCTGLVVCPGFIDLHNHSDDEVLEKETRSAMNYLTQGCTTLVTGNCGSGPIDVGAYYDRIDEGGAGTNIMHLLPQGNLRDQVIGSEQRPATAEELDRMRGLAEQAMKDGAWGMSTGLIYVPSSYADTDELVAIAEVVGLHGGIYVSHIRNEGAELLQSVGEAIEIGKRANLPVHISHFKSSGQDAWGLVRRAVAIIKEQRAAGRIITADQYPYTASSTSLGATCIPAWARSGGRDKMIARIDRGDDQSTQITDAIRRKLDITDNGHRIQIAACEQHPEWAGRRLDEIAAELGIEPLALVLQIERDGGAAVVNHSINEADVRFVMQQPWVATASDGSAKLPTASVPHPRNYGTFPRRIGYYANRENVISMAAAIHSATGLPAEILGIEDRGYLRPGYFADVAVFDAQQFIDRATFVQPHQYSDGLQYVFVNGMPAIERGRATGALNGRAVRKTPSASLP